MRMTEGRRSNDWYSSEGAENKQVGVAGDAKIGTAIHG
jgi:hypothetical protein